MGSRAGYAIRREGVTTTFGSRWGASSIMSNIFWGPEQATESISGLSSGNDSSGKKPGVEIDDSSDVDDIDGGDEGSVLIDWDEKRLVWWSALCSLSVHQKLFNRLAASNWPGWQIEYAVGGQNEILKRIGLEAPVEDDEEETDDFSSEGLAKEEFSKPMIPDGPIRDMDELETGCWLTIRPDDGDWKDYFLVGYSENELLQIGKSILRNLPRKNELGEPSPEILTDAGVVIDCQTNTIGRWTGRRDPWSERKIRNAWPGFKLRDLENGWVDQVNETGRVPGDLKAGQRQILGAVVTHVLYEGAFDIGDLVSSVTGCVNKIRNAGVVITLFIGLVGGGLAVWLKSWALAIFVAILFVPCFLVTVWVWRKVSEAFSAVDRVPTPEVLKNDMTPEQKRAMMSSALVGAGFPSLEDLEATEEVSDPAAWCDDDFDDIEDDE